MMPTAARMFASIGFAAVAFFASESFIFELPEGTNAGWFSVINAGLGVIIGWRVLGSEAGRGFGPALTSGLKTGALITFFALLGHSLYEMIRLSMKLRFDGPLDAINGMFALMIEYGTLVVTSFPVMAILIVGSLLVGWLSDWAASRWN